EHCLELVFRGVASMGCTRWNRPERVSRVTRTTFRTRGTVPMAILHFRCKERRRTVRVMLTVPLKVHGQSVDGESFSIETRSHTVRLHGASLELPPKLVLGDLLRLENDPTREKIEGKVVTIRHSRDGKT